MALLVSETVVGLYISSSEWCMISPHGPANVTKKHRSGFRTHVVLYAVIHSHRLNLVYY